MSATAQQQLATAIGQTLIRRQWQLSTAESCTGGLLAACCTDIAGASQWFHGGFVTYANAAKTQMLAVPPDVLNRHGAVSEATARAMAQGAQAHTGTQVAIATSGIAGPDGGSPDKPVGTVWIAWATPAMCHAQCFHFTGSRHDIRHAAVLASLQKMQQLLG
jgi:nicotinamide-nucleotide amidase